MFCGTAKPSTEGPAGAPADGFGLRGKSLKATRGMGLYLSLDVLNALNENSPNIIGFKQGDYGRVYSIVQPRTYRVGAKLMF